MKQFYTMHEQICTRIKAYKQNKKERYINNKHTNQTIKHNNLIRTKLSPQGSLVESSLCCTLAIVLSGVVIGKSGNEIDKEFLFFISGKRE